MTQAINTNSAKVNFMWGGKKVTPKDFKQIPIVHEFQKFDKGLGVVNYPFKADRSTSYMVFERAGVLTRILLSDQVQFHQWADEAYWKQSRFTREEHQYQYHKWARMLKGAPTLFI